jgi:uncharacterized membrane protein
VADQSSQWPRQSPPPGNPAAQYPPPAQYPSAQYPSGPYSHARIRQYPQTQMHPAMRASSADRERAVDVLKAGFAEGRLTQDEYNERMSQAYEARTYADLAALTVDLPVGPVPPGMMQQWRSAPVTRTNSMAIASMILGIAEIPTAGLTAIPAIVCGHVARREIRHTQEQGGGMATAGLVLGYLAVTLWALVIISAMMMMAIVRARTGGPAG